VVSEATVSFASIGMTFDASIWTTPSRRLSRRRDRRSATLATETDPSGLREREIVVSADVPWNDAGIEVRGGQSLYFSAAGRVNWGPGRRDGAAGERHSPHNPTRPIPSRPGAALIGRIGEQDPFFIGDDRGPVRMRQSGRLYVGINDDYLADNSGTFRVTVYH
jgi:hypothetical protein